MPNAFQVIEGRDLGVFDEFYIEILPLLLIVFFLDIYKKD